MSAPLAVLNRTMQGSLLGFGAKLLQTVPYDTKRIPPGVGARPGDPLTPAWDSDRAVKEGLKTCAIAATCVFRVSEKAASVPWYYWSQNKSGKMKREEIVPFIEYPRSDGKISRYEMLDEAHHHAQLSGNALFGLLWNGGRKYRLNVSGMQVENPQGCAPIPDRLLHIKGYQWDDADGIEQRYWDAEDIIHVIARCDPANRYWGWSIFEALATTIDAEVQARLLNLRRFTRNGTPGGVLIDEDIDDEIQRREIEEDLNRRVEKMFGSFMVLGGKQRLESVRTMSELELGLLRAIAMNRDEIAVALGYHPAMFSNEAATFDNMENARKMEWQMAVLKNDRFSDAFTNKLIDPKERGDRVIAPYYGRVSELQDLRKQIDETKDLVNGCRVALNDAIEMTGLPAPPQEGGDVPLAQSNLAPVSAIVEMFDE